MSAWSAALECHKALSFVGAKTFHCFVSAQSTFIRTIMAEMSTLRDDLCKEIVDYVLRWRHERTGDATAAELAIMACVLSNEPLSKTEAMSWMCCHSDEPFSIVDNVVTGGRKRLGPSHRFSDVAMYDESDELNQQQSDRLESFSHLRDEVNDPLRNFTVPIHEFDHLGSKHWTSPISSANVFLRRRLFPYKTGIPSSHFRIMDLPVEVREMIFEFALLLPRSGVWYDFQTRYKRCGERYLTLRAWTRDRDFISAEYLPYTWNIDKPWPHARPKALFRVNLESHLALFRVSKQVYKEAFACYYSQNVFYLPNDYAFLKLFQNMSDAQFRYLGNFVWRWTRTEPPSEKHVQQFAALPRLRTLVIDAKEEEEEGDEQVDFMFNWNQDTGLSYDDVSYLTAIRGLQDVVFFGPIAKHEQFLRSQMVGRKSGVDSQGLGVAILQRIDPMLA
jgi:hypothetical protein